MITMIIGYLGTAAGGALMKGFFGVISEWLVGNQEKERALIDAASRRETIHIEKFNSSDNWTKYTRRVLAWGMCFTYCTILLLWAIYPTVEILTLVEFGAGEPTGYGFTLFGYELIGTQAPVNLSERTIMVTTGHLVVANSYVLTFILSAYFMPVGRR